MTVGATSLEQFWIIGGGGYSKNHRLIKTSELLHYALERAGKKEIAVIFDDREGSRWQLLANEWRYDRTHRGLVVTAYEGQETYVPIESILYVQVSKR